MQAVRQDSPVSIHDIKEYLNPIRGCKPEHKSVCISKSFPLKMVLKKNQIIPTQNQNR